MGIVANAMAVIEIARVDASMSTFLLVHSYLAMLTINLLGSEQQKRELLPGMASLNLVGCWALTGPSNGSDAAALTTTATRVRAWLASGAICLGLAKPYIRMHTVFTNEIQAQLFTECMYGSG